MSEAMTRAENDELAKLSYGLANNLKKHEARETIASMFGVTEDDAWDLYVRGKDLARREKGKAA